MNDNPFLGYNTVFDPKKTNTEKEELYHLWLKTNLEKDPRINKVIHNKGTKNGRPDLIIFLNQPLIMKYEKSNIQKCFAIEIKIDNGVSRAAHGIKQSYDKYKEMIYDGTKIEKVFLATDQSLNTGRYLGYESVKPPYEDCFLENNPCDFVLTRVIWAFDMGDVKRIRNEWVFSQDENCKFRIQIFEEKRPNVKDYG